MRIVTITSVCALLVSATCRDRLPTARSELTTGIVIHQHANFLGDWRDTFNDCASSVRVFRVQ
jgi:hypothetical protein